MILENKEPNYSATVIKVHTLVPLANRDRIVALPVFGYQALVSVNTEVGQLGVLFTAETQLSEDFCKHNNLYSNSELNADKEQMGYLDERRRVRAIKFAGNISSALFLPLNSLDYLGIDTNQLKEGDCFTHIDGKEVCKKYFIPSQGHIVKGPSSPKPTKNRVSVKLIPEHVDSTNWWKNESTIHDKRWIIATQKLHGTSVRLAHQVCNKELSYWEKWAKWFGFDVKDTEYDYFACSRRVIKDTKRKDAHQMQHYYPKDIYNQAMEKYGQVIPKNWVIYGELIGWCGQSPIQKSYTYQIPQGEFEMYVYRIAVVNEDGVSVDIAWGQVKDFCEQSGLKYVPELWQGEKKDFNVDVYMNKGFHKVGLRQCVPLSPESPCDEGVIVRVNGLTPRFLKAKSPLFLNHETELLDQGVEDMESLQ